jgi:hypothetical protein
LGTWVRLAAFSALAVDNDTCAGAVRTEDTIFNIKGILLAGLFLTFLFERDTALHAVAALPGDMGAACGASFSGYFFMTMRAFHNCYQLFLDVFTWNGEITCFTLVLLHLGHLNFVFSYSETDMMWVNFPLHFSHLKSYVGISLSSV